MGRTTYTPTRPAFLGDLNSIVVDHGHQVDWASVSEDRRTTPGGTVVVAAAGAIKGATSIPVDALVVAVKAGTMLDFGGAGLLPAKITADAAVGAESLSCIALLAALTDNDAAIVAGTGPKFLPAGTVVGMKKSRDATPSLEQISPRVVTSNPAEGILASDAVENDQSAALTGYGVIRGGSIYENLLPEATGTPKVLASAVKNELQTAGVGTGFMFLQYSDSR